MAQHSIPVLDAFLNCCLMKAFNPLHTNPDNKEETVPMSLGAVQLICLFCMLEESGVAVQKSTNVPEY